MALDFMFEPKNKVLSDPMDIELPFDLPMVKDPFTDFAQSPKEYQPKDFPSFLNFGQSPPKQQNKRGR